MYFTSHVLVTEAKKGANSNVNFYFHSFEDFILLNFMLDCPSYTFIPTYTFIKFDKIVLPTRLFGTLEYGDEGSYISFLAEF